MIRARHIKGFLSSLDNKQTITYLLRSIVFYVCFLLFAGADILGQTTYTSVKSGPWHEAATWGGSGTPGKSDIAIIEKNHTVTIYPAFPGWPEVNINKLIVKASGKLEFWGANYLYVNNADGLIQVDNDGIIDGGIFANSYIVYRTSNDQQLIVNGSVTNLGGLVFSNSESTISISGNGNINIRHNIRLTGNNNITVINSLAGSLTVGGDIIFERNNCEFINKGTGNVSVGGDLVFKELNCEFINNGELNILKCIRVDQPNKNNNILRNDPSGRITLGSDFNPRYSRFIIDNSGFVDLNGNITNVEPGEVKIYNRAGSEFRWAGQELDLNSNPNSNPNLMLYCDYDSNNFIYDGTGPQSIIPPRDSAYWNLITNGANTKTLKGQIIIRNDLTIGTGSILDVSSNNYNIEIEGDWVHETGGQFTERQGTVIFSGANSQKMTVDGAETFYGLTVDKTGGLVNLINGNITVSNLMTLTSGNIDIGSNNLIIPSSGSIAGGSSSSYVVTEGTGSLKRYVNGAISFPIGAATSYLPIILNNTGSPDNFSANIFQSVTVNGLLGGSQVPDYDDYVKYTWRVVEENPGGSDLAVTVQWNGTPDEGTGFSRSECSMGYHNSVSWSSEAPSAVLAALPYTKTRTGIAGGGSFSVGNKCTRVGDHQPPVITAMPTDTMGYLNGDCEFIIPDYRSGFTVSDNCAVPVITQSPVGSTLSGHGTTQDIVFTIDDGHGNVLTRSIRLTLRDTIPPVFTAPPNITICRDLDCKFNIDVINTGDVHDELDNCSTGIEAYVYKDDFTNSLDCDNAGYVTRIWRLEDGNGNFTEHQQIIYIEPTPRVTGTISNDIICNNTPVTYTVTTPTTAIYGVRFDVQVINPHPEVTGVNNRTGLEDSDTITETPSNTDDSPKMITYIITPYTITSDGYYKCAGINDTMRLWINPTPVVIPVNVNPICYGGLTDINLVTPTKMTSGIINFDFFVSNTGDIVGDTIDGEDLVHGDKISRSFINNSDTIQSVNFWIIASNDDLGCIGDTTLAEVKVHALPLQDLIITKPLTCEGGSDATLKAVFSKGATPLSVNWIGPSGYEENYTINDSIQEVSGLEGGGVYRVTVTDNLNCRNSLDAAPVGAIFDTHFYLREKASGYGTTCPGSDDGEIWVTQRGGSSGIPPFNYWIVYNDDATIYTGILLSKGATDTLKNLRPGRYKLYLHDANGCFDISYPEINIVDPPPIEISFRIDRNITCKNYSDGSVSASVTGGIGEYSYLWYRPPYDPPLEITDNEASLDGISAGKYYLRIIDQMGCIKTDSITIDEPEGMTLVEYDLSMSNHPAFHISCNGASDGYIKLSVEGGSGEYTYLWTGPDGFTAITRDIFNLKAGIYDCTVTDIGGCELMPHPHFELVEPDILSVTAVSPLFGAGPYNIGCFGETGSIDVTVTGGTTGSYYYEWTTSNGSGLVTDEGDQEHVSAGIYTLVVTDLNGCTETTTVTLTQPAEIVLELIPTHITCQSETFDNGSINLVLSGGVEPYSYEWSDEEGPIPGGILQDIYDLTPGTYTVMVTDANGCRVSGSVEVTLPPDLEYEKRVSKYGDYQISCFGRSDGFIQITPTSGREPYVVSWQMPDGSVSASNDLAGLTAGEYILYITDSNMCSARDTIRLEEPGKLTMNVTVSDQICSNDHTGSIAVEAVNNAGPVDYLWADGVIGNYREGLSAGAYRIIITDSNNCNADSTILINEAEPIKLLFTVIQPECTDMPDGSVTVTASGGTGPGTYSYLWSDGSTGERINTVASGWYSVAVADINGCYVRDSVFVAPKKEVCLNIPNAISPNGDGVNDEWNIGLKELYPLMEVKIFNRWGELLWASEKGYPNPWDGRSRGAVLPVDSYHYTIDLHNGSKLIIGHITIVR